MSYIFYEAERKWANDAFAEKEYANKEGHTECVAFIQQAAKAPLTKYWKPGIRIKDAKPGDIHPGTAIATFENGKYPTVGSRHAAIYLSHTSVSIRVLDQWKDTRTTVDERHIGFNRSRHTKGSNDGNLYYVIEEGREEKI
jgi:hypothetical protein